ncbi:peptidase S8 [Kroppenstedtia pulmonis]|uniref:Peptidase S8 n=2 Tax=Kroppenstedtia pulmonis TaxID=1380685 RepID=A0A7D3XKB4_9BACL|nr:S8 family peptidase [Kroppenstedtia pulmonis]QKG85439.1 peptidase S8 [Kroppenstedtia pulmonis]
MAVLLTLGMVALPSTMDVHASKAEKNGDYVPGEVIVKFKSGASKGKMRSAHQDAEAKVVSENKEVGFQVVKVKEQSVKEAVKEYQANPNVEYAEPNTIFKAMDVPNDPDFSKQWGLETVKAPAAWDVTTGSKDVKVAIVDTGVDYEHEDLKGKVELGGDYIDHDDDPMDENGHGTHCAGIAAASTNNGVGIAGMAPDVTIYAVRVLDANGSGTLDAVANGITDAADAGAEVISLSLGASQGGQALQEAVQYADSKGSFVVAAAGNDGSTSPNYPAYYDEVMAVAATDSNDQKAYFSNYGSWVDVAAPGVDIYATYPNGKYESLSGTSMATPHVAGLGGLLASQGKKGAEIRSTIEKTSDEISGTGSDWKYGRINAQAAVSQ